MFTGKTCLDLRLRAGRLKLLCRGLAFEEADGLLNHGRQTLEIGDEDEEVLVGLGVGREVEAAGAHRNRGGGDQRFDVGDNGGKALDEWLPSGFSAAMIFWIFWDRLTVS